MDLVYFALTAYGLTQILVYGKIFQDIRPSKEKFKGFFHCPMCVGYHCGWFLMLLGPFTDLWSYEINLVNAFCLSCLSSATSYVLNMIVSDDGIQVKNS